MCIVYMWGCCEDVALPGCTVDSRVTSVSNFMKWLKFSCFLRATSLRQFLAGLHPVHWRCGIRRRAFLGERPNVSPSALIHQTHSKLNFKNERTSFNMHFRISDRDDIGALSKRGLSVSVRSYSLSASLETDETECLAVSALNLGIHRGIECQRIHRLGGCFITSSIIISTGFVVMTQWQSKESPRISFNEILWKTSAAFNGHPSGAGESSSEDRHDRHDWPFLESS